MTDRDPEGVNHPKEYKPMKERATGGTATFVIRFFCDECGEELDTHFEDWEFRQSEPHECLGERYRKVASAGGDGIEPIKDVVVEKGVEYA